jgi:phosphatidate cytidylyltransferase
VRRFLTAAVLVPLVVWGVLWAPSAVFLGIMALIGVGAFREYDTMVEGHAIAASGWMGVALGLAFLLTPEPLQATLAIIAVIAMAWQLRETSLERALPGAGAALLGVLYVFGGWRCARMLREIDPHWLMVALLVSWIGDTAAMAAGKTMGRHKLAPTVSPGKTREGAIASVLGGMAAAATYGAYFLPERSFPMLLGVGALANIAGQVGDLCESAFKRGAGMKDSGTMLPGHGGWLDRIDSTLFAVPVVYAIVRWL